MKRSYDFRDKNDVLKTVNDPRNEVRFVRFIFPDILGRMMDFTIPVSELTEAFERGKGFDGSSLDGPVRVNESDLKIFPEPQTCRILPWSYKGNNGEFSWKEAVIFGNIYTSNNEHFAGDTRHVLKKILGKAGEAYGVTDLMVGAEPEFFLFPSSDDPTPLDQGGYFFSGKNGIIRKEVQLLLEDMGIKCEYDHHEVAPSQHEVDLKYADAVTMADSLMIYRYIVKKVARMHGIYATFMPKPIDGQNGSGMHLHQSLWNKNKNMFFDEKDRYGLSQFAKKYVAGLIEHGNDISLICNQWVNSYKRLQPNFEAPVYRVWGRRNRSSYVRIPEFDKQKESSSRVELRSPDPTSNLYLTFSAMLSAGLQGVKDNLDLSYPVEKDVFSMSEEDLIKLPKLPKNFEDALATAKKSKLLRLSLGDHVFKKIMVNKELELKEYKENVGDVFDNKVSTYEIKRYMSWL